MPIHIEELDSSAREENPTLILGKNILLKIVEDSNKQALLKNNVVKKFVSIPNLCSDDVRQLIGNLFEQETYLTAPSFVRTLMQGKEKLEALPSILKWVEQAMSPLMDAKIFKVVEKGMRAKIEDDDFKELSKRKDLLQDFMFRVKGQIDRKELSEYEKKIVSIDKEIEKRTGSKITIPSTLFVCFKCKAMLLNNEIANKECMSCGKKINEENMERIPIYKIPDEIKSVWSSNLWFEAYIAGLLQKLNCKTWTSVHAMGASGILHEVDVLAIKNGTVLICECKTGKVSRNDVFNFCTKIGDLKAHISILALIGELPEPETREFIKKNPAIIRLENMGRMSEVEILDYLKNRLSIKA